MDFKTKTREIISLKTWQSSYGKFLYSYGKLLGDINSTTENVSENLFLRIEKFDFHGIGNELWKYRAILTYSLKK